MAQMTESKPEFGSCLDRLIRDLPATGTDPLSMAKIAAVVENPSEDGLVARCRVPDCDAVRIIGEVGAGAFGVVEDANICNRLLEVARTAPKADLPEGAEQRTQFGDNFFLLFNALRARNAGQARHLFFDVYLERIESLGDPWKRFEGANRELFESIYRVLEDKKGFDELFRAYSNAFFSRRRENIEALREATGHPRGIDAIGDYYWGQLNPLLEEAATRMEAAGIDPTQFY